MYFVSKGFAVTATYYPAPNNHIFSNLLSCLIQLFIDNTLLIMRLPSFIFSIILGAVLFLFYKKHFSYFTAIAAYLFYSFSFQMNFYAVQGRGYLLLTMCSFLLLVICFKYTSAQKRAYLFAFTFISIIGFYTIPTFLYPFVASIIFLHFYFFLNKNINPLFKLYAAYCAVLAGVLLLYAPVFLVSGVSSLVSNSWVRSLSLNDWINSIPSYLGDSAIWLLNVETGGGVLLIFIMVWNIFIHTQRSERVFQLLSIIHLLIPILLIGVQRVLPFFRIWIYLIPIISFWIGGICSGFKKRYLKLAYILALAAAMLFSDLRAFRNDFGFYDEMNLALSKIFEVIPQNVYCEEDTYYVFLNYYGIKHHVSLNVDDTYEALTNYDFLILKPQSNFSHQGYDLIVENQYVVVYVRNK
nr:glycosyltransferase family 39 protein [Sporocytophaga myxococcoides]